MPRCGIASTGERADLPKELSSALGSVKSVLHSVKRNLRNPLAVYTALAVAGTALVIVAVAPLTSTVVQRWSERDVELRSRLVFNSIRDQVATSLAFATGADLVPFFESLTEDERLLALGYCGEGGVLEHATKHMPKGIACPRPDRTKGGTFARVYEDGQRMLVGAFPLNVASTRGDLIILHDLSFVDERTSRARLYTAVAIVAIISGIGLLALASVLGVLRVWSETARSAIADARRGLEPRAQSATGCPCRTRCAPCSGSSATTAARATGCRCNGRRRPSAGCWRSACRGPR